MKDQRKVLLPFKARSNEVTVNVYMAELDTSFQVSVRWYKGYVFEHSFSEFHETLLLHIFYNGFI